MRSGADGLRGEVAEPVVTSLFFLLPSIACNVKQWYYKRDDQKFRASGQIRYIYDFLKSNIKSVPCPEIKIKGAQNDSQFKTIQNIPFFRYGNNECHICGGKDKATHDSWRWKYCGLHPSIFGAYKEYEWPNMGWVYFHKIDGSEQVDKSNSNCEQQETQKLAANKNFIHSMRILKEIPSPARVQKSI